MWAGWDVTTVCAKAFVAYIREIVPARNVLAACVFWTGIFHLQFVP
jgi:hypothetical protein